MTAYRALVAALLLGCGTVDAADRGRMVEIQYDGQRRIGTVVLHNDTTGWFLERDGRLEAIPLGEVSEFRELGKFQPLGVVGLREQLTREFGPKFTVSSSAHYLVVAPPGVGERFTRLFERLYRQLVVVFTAQGFRIHEPEFPLVAVVLPDEPSFFQYCRKERVRPQPGLRGYYLPSSNRVALFDASLGGLADPRDLDDTIVHEATHQVAFNLGIHSRMSADPKWVVEGLATVFEREEARLNDRRQPIATRVNSDRLAWFQRYREERRELGSLVRLIQSDDLFDAAPFDAYSEAWALTFYLLERQPTEFVAYLRRLSRRDPWLPYSADDRLQDFRLSFGRDLALLETQFLRYYANLLAGDR